MLLATWTIVLVASIAMPVLPRFTPVGFPLDPALSRPLIDGAANLLQQPSLQALSDGDTVVELRAQPSPGSWLETVYVVVGCGILLRVMLGVGLSFRLLARAVPVRPEWAAGHRVRISRDVTGPVTIAHVILLPIDAAEWSAETRQAVLAHERAHVARWDFAMLVVSQLNQALFWFNPLSWWLHRRLVTLTELASDDQAMAATRDRLGYAEILLEMGRRSGSASRGSAMARPMTLLYRIDRILLDQVNLRRVSRPQQVLLTVGMAGLSLGVASLTHDPVSNPAKAPPATQWSSQNERPVPPALPTLEQQAAARQVVPPEVSPATAMPPFGAETRTEARSQSAPPSPSQASLAGTAAQPTRLVTLVPRPALRTSAKTTPVPPPSRATGRPHPVATGQAGSNGTADPHVPGTRGAPPPAAADSDVTTRPGMLAEDEGHSSLSHQVTYGFLSFHPGLEGIAGSTCTGTVAVGMRASGGPPNRPNVVPGQTVPAQAEFFRKENGVLWVRFNAFGRPPLDLPVRFARSGMTWTGEFGIAYTVQATGGNHLAGLAALVANDSAKLDFACSRSASHLL